MSKLKLLCACLGLLFLTPQSQASLFSSVKNMASGGGGNSFDAIGQMIGSLKGGSKNVICKEGGVCRKLNGFACGFSKNLVSTCALICENQQGFKASKCSQEAKKSFRFDVNSLSYGGQEGVADHLARQLEKGRAGNNPAAQKFFDAFCLAKATNLIEPEYKGQIKQACNVYLGKSSPQGENDGADPMADPMSEDDSAVEEPAPVRKAPARVVQKKQPVQQQRKAPVRKQQAPVQEEAQEEEEQVQDENMDEPAPVRKAPARIVQKKQPVQQQRKAPVRKQQAPVQEETQEEQFQDEGQDEGQDASQDENVDEGN